MRLTGHEGPVKWYVQRQIEQRNNNEKAQNE